MACKRVMEWMGLAAPAPPAPSAKRRRVDMVDAPNPGPMVAKPFRPANPNTKPAVVCTDVQLAHTLDDQQETFTRIMSIDQQFPVDNRMSEEKVRRAIAEGRMLVATLPIPKGGQTKRRVVGFLVYARKSSDHWTLDKIAVHANYGGRKMGTALMEKWAKRIPVERNPGIMVDLHVRGGNDAAAALYTKSGWANKGVVGRFKTGGKEEKLLFLWPREKILETRAIGDKRAAVAAEVRNHPPL